MYVYVYIYMYMFRAGTVACFVRSVARCLEVNPGLYPLRRGSPGGLKVPCSY